MRAGAFLSRHLDGERACLDATSSAMRQAGKEGPPDLLWLVSVAHDADTTARGLAAAARLSGAREAVAVTAAGVHASQGGEVEREPAVGALVLYGAPELTAWNGRERRPAWDGVPLAVLMDPDGSPLQRLRLLHGVWDAARVAGGAATGVGVEAAVLHHGTGPVDLLALQPGAPVCEVGVAQGCTAVGDTMVVTRAEGNLVMELDGRPALARVLDQLQPDERRDVARSLGRCMVALHADGEDAEAFRNSAFTVRRLVGVAPDVGAVAVGESPRAGEGFTLVRRDAGQADRFLSQAVRGLKQRLEGSSPVAALYFTCAGRGTAMFGREGAELATIQRVFPGVPLLGMASAFELGPVGPGAPAVHLFTGVLMVLAQGN
ncbi:MAG: FIST C-terminal domain-containing protein [Deltaproteobacteria bacterium]|nr:FIST C-terminal domain-containing protein [Deltaproteobacteria bacterium]